MLDMIDFIAEAHASKQAQVDELTAVLGQEFSCNFSPTLSAKLVDVNIDYCTWRVVPSKYNPTRGMQDVGLQKITPTGIIWNCFFY